MTDPLIAIVKIAGITLLITILWALTLAVAYWDIQRRKQSGQRGTSLAWLIVVGFLPFLGLMVYLIARLFSRPSTKDEQAFASSEGRRETRFKRPPEIRMSEKMNEVEPLHAARQPLPTIQTSDFNKATVLTPRNDAPVEVSRPALIYYQFSITRGPNQGKQFRVDHFPAQIGRDLDSIIRLEDDGVSRKHALVYQMNGTLRIRDLNSRHGTRVNGKPITDDVLGPGDRIELGLTSLLYENLEG